MRYYLFIGFVFGALHCMSQVKSTDGLNIYVEDRGKGDTTLLFIHGWNLDHTFWQYQIDVFRQKYRCVAPDLPGYGRSGSGRSAWSMNSYGSDVRSIIDQLGLKNVILVAHSMGGNIALEAYTKDPSEIIGIIGVDNFKAVGAEPDSSEAGQLEAFYAMLEEDYPKNVRLAVEGFMFHENSPADPKEKILSVYAAADPATAIAVFKAAYKESSFEAAQLEKTTIPFTLISSVNIPFNEPRFLAHYGGSRFRNFEMQNTGHFPMFEDPASFNHNLEKALAFMFDNH
ncbi:MAG: alpha/beta hydrolase [Cyclobacteriaceae bacterium]